MKLTAPGVKHANTPGRYGDGRGSHGLALLVQARRGGDGVTKSWVQRLRIDGRPTNVGLGSYPLITLSMARDRAIANARLVANGGDPRRVQPAAPTFDQAARKVLAIRRKAWRTGSSSEYRWRLMASKASERIGSMRVDQTTAGDVLAVLTPIWADKQETARRVRTVAAQVFDWAIAQGYRADNPAGEAVLAVLPTQTRQVKHRKALPYDQVTAALATVRESSASDSAKLALEWVVLTACRPGEATGASWDEIDGDTWAIPASRSKTGNAHTVPLSSRAREVLAEARSLHRGRLLFPSPRGGELAVTTLRHAIQDLGIDGTTHGFRASFRSWCADNEVPHDVGEMCLGHVVRGVAAAYQRSDLIERRRPIMQAWSDYLSQVE